MSNKTDLMLYKELKLSNGWVINVDKDGIMEVTKYGNVLDIPGLTGVHAQNLEPDANITELLNNFIKGVCTKYNITLQDYASMSIPESTVFLGAETATMSPNIKMVGIPRGEMSLFGAICKKVRSKFGS